MANFIRVRLNNGSEMKIVGEQIVSLVSVGPTKVNVTMSNGDNYIIVAAYTNLKKTDDLKID